MKTKNKKLIKGAFVVSLLCLSIAFYSGCNKKTAEPTIMSETITSSSNSNSNKSRTSTEYSGEQIFKGIFFIRGGFKNEIASYRDVDVYAGLTTEQLATLNDLHTRVINQMKVISPDCFNSFGNEVKTGSASRTDRAMDAIAVIFYKAMSQMPEYAEIAKLNRDESFISKDSKNFNDVSTNPLIESNPDLLCNNSLCTPQGRQVSAAFAVVVVAIFAAAIHNTVAVTANGAIAINGAIAVYLAVWKYKYFFSGSALLLEPATDFPSNYRNLYSLKYEDFVNDVAKVYQ